jgi:hypothetical protein
LNCRLACRKKPLELETHQIILAFVKPEKLCGIVKKGSDVKNTG